MAAVITRDIIKKFGEVPAVNGISLTVPDGEFMVLLGPSGCGKTTFLRIICGLEKQTSGDLLIGGNIVNDIPPRARGVAMMFQSYGLYPHFTVRNNIAFPLKTQSVPRAEIEKKVGRVSCRAANASVSHLRARSCANRPRCCSTSRSRTLTPNCAPRPAWRSSNSSSGSASPQFM
jgi:multiple sugar transport system ATP-binding protein